MFNSTGNNVVITKVRCIRWILNSQYKQNGSILAGNTEILILAKLVSTVMSEINFVKRLCKLDLTRVNANDEMRCNIDRT